MSVKTLIICIVIGIIASLLEIAEFAQFSLVILWLSILGGLGAIIWFPFEFVKSTLEKERKEESERILKDEQE